MASEGSFGAYQMQARDNSGKILEAADKKIRGMERARAFEKEQEELYLRAQKFAQGREEQSRELNFKLETENRKEFMEATKLDFQNQLEADKAQLRQPTQQENQLAALIPQLAEAFATGQKNNAENRRKAASAAAYEHGLSHVTLKNVLGLSANLNLSQFKATEYVGSLSEVGWSEERIDALYKHQYLTRGDKAWVDNKALLINSIPNYEIGAQAITADNADKSPDEQINALRAYTQDWIANLSIGDRPVSAEMMGTVVNPKVRSIETRLLRDLQKSRATARESALLSDKNRSYTTTFATDKVQGVHALFSSSANKAEERKFLTEWAVNSHKSGAMSKDELDRILTANFERSDGALVNLRDNYGGTDEVAKALDYLNRIDGIELTRFNNDRAVEMRSMQSQTVEFLNANRDGLTMEILEDHLAEQRAIRPDFTSPELEAAREWTPSGLAMAEMLPIAAQRVEDGAGEQDLKDLGLSESAVSQEVNGMPSLLSRARQNDKARQNPKFKNSAKDIEAEIKDNENVQANSVFITKKGLNYEINHWKGIYNKEYWTTINKGANADQADEIARAKVLVGIEDYFSKEKNSANGLIRLKETIPEAEKKDRKINEFNKKLTDLRLNDANKGRHAQTIGPELFKESTKAMEMGTPIPESFTEAASIVGKTPFEYQQYLAPAFPGVDQAEFDASSFRSMMNSIKPEKMPLIRNTYGVALRPDRARGGASTAARRGSYAIPMPAGVQTPAWSAAGAVIKFAEGTFNLGNVYNVKFGGGTFDDYSRHPDQVMSSNGLNSAAAGAYQFMPSTWKGVSEKLGLQDFGPESQEMAFRELLIGRGVDPERVCVSFEDFNNNFLIPLAPEWASLPTRNGQSYYSGQTAKSAQALWQYYQQALKQFGVN